MQCVLAVSGHSYSIYATCAGSIGPQLLDGVDGLLPGLIITLTLTLTPERVVSTTDHHAYQADMRTLPLYSTTLLVSYSILHLSSTK